MHRKVFRSPWALGICVALVGARCYAASGTLRIVSWNIEDDINGATTPLPGFNTVLQGIGNETIGSDPAQPLDILALEETTSNTTTVQPIVNYLNSDYAGANYQMSAYQATESDNDTGDGNGPNAIVYNANKLTLLASVGVVTPTGTGSGGNGVDRQPVRYEFQPVGDTGSNGIFYVYVSHAKSASGSNYMTYQNDEAVIIRNDEATNLPANASVLYTGDLNGDPNESGETGSTGQFTTYEKATATNTSTNLTVTQGAATDPVNASTSVAYLSESSTDLRYRDDYQLMTANVANGTGAINYVASSFHYLGNNGSVASRGNIKNSTALAYMASGYNPTQSQILSALTTASDHLPAIADYTYATPEPGGCSLAAAAFAFALTRRRRSPARGMIRSS